MYEECDTERDGIDDTDGLRGRREGGEREGRGER
jgi:hypothetical protein